MGWGAAAGAGLNILGGILKSRAAKKGYNLAQTVSREASEYGKTFADTGLKGFQGAQAQRDALANPFYSGMLSPDSLQALSTWDVDQSKIAGFDPKVLAAMQGQAIDAVPGRFNDALAQMKINAGRRGLSFTPGMGQFLAAKETNRAQSLRDIMIQNEMQRLLNVESARKQGLSTRQLGFGTAMNTLGAIGNTYDPSLYNPMLTAGLGSSTQASMLRAQLAAPGKQSAWGNALSNIGSALSNMGMGSKSGGGPYSV